MKKYINTLLFFLFVCLIFLSSCASVYYGDIKTDAQLQTNNFKIVKTVQGSAQATYIFGFGGNKFKDGLYAQAKKSMLENNPLSPNQTLTNVTVDVKKKYGIIRSFTRVTITADVVEFTK